jgi:hypothetical protein
MLVISSLLIILTDPNKKRAISVQLNNVKYPSEFPKTQKTLDQMSLYKV